MIRVVYKFNGNEYNDYDDVYNDALYVAKLKRCVVSFEKMMLSDGIARYMATHYVTPSDGYIG